MLRYQLKKSLKTKTFAFLLVLFFIIPFFLHNIYTENKDESLYLYILSDNILAEAMEQTVQNQDFKKEEYKSIIDQIEDLNKNIRFYNDQLEYTDSPSVNKKDISIKYENFIKNFNLFLLENKESFLTRTMNSLEVDETYLFLQRVQHEIDTYGFYQGSDFVSATELASNFRFIFESPVFLMFTIASFILLFENSEKNIKIEALSPLGSKAFFYRLLVFILAFLLLIIVFNLSVLFLTKDNLSTSFGILDLVENEMFENSYGSKVYKNDYGLVLFAKSIFIYFILSFKGFLIYDLSRRFFEYNKSLILTLTIVLLGYLVYTKTNFNLKFLYLTNKDFTMSYNLPYFNIVLSIGLIMLNSLKAIPSFYKKTSSSISASTPKNLSSLSFEFLKVKRLGYFKKLLVVILLFSVIVVTFVTNRKLIAQKEKTFDIDASIDSLNEIIQKNLLLSKQADVKDLIGDLERQKISLEKNKKLYLDRNLYPDDYYKHLVKVSQNNLLATSEPMASEIHFTNINRIEYFRNNNIPADARNSFINGAIEPSLLINLPLKD